MQGSFQLCFPHVSCMLSVIAYRWWAIRKDKGSFLIANQDDVCARLKVHSIASLASPRCRSQEPNVLYCDSMRDAELAE